MSKQCHSIIRFYVETKVNTTTVLWSFAILRNIYPQTLSDRLWVTLHPLSLESLTLQAPRQRLTCKSAAIYHMYIINTFLSLTNHFHFNFRSIVFISKDQILIKFYRIKTWMQLIEDRLSRPERIVRHCIASVTQLSLKSKYHEVSLCVVFFAIIW